ncbi:helix-turn-helix domain-containing protein [Synoicihabitans lomoniglobus]|uniref:AraC family transcriptional regulator n=1 Tax=Synoicihabitans lomoniglobus TaxID=2909285 RepID=A0AAF0A173_9BACT|nr:AraC family transcriptional regulator [Opitutaceae bacterium LMO-M01]WED64777.1 AraC family transcriptional regulator [Opitutaceae bacterium LMO-M01]
MKPSTLLAHDPRMARVRTQLGRNLDEPLDLETLARDAGVSVRQLERVFARCWGESPRACRRRLRLERAARRLRRSRRSILTIALEAGYASHEAFTRGFTARFGRGPAEYRKSGDVTTAPRDRHMMWTQAWATGLRRHVERPTQTRDTGPA